MRRTLILIAAFLLTAGVADAQLRTQPGGSIADAEWVEFEVVSVERSNWTVSAKDVESGETFRFRMPPQVFQGQRFNADLSQGEGGRPFDVRGEVQAKLDKMVLEAPLGGATAPGANRSPSAPRRMSPPGALGAPGTPGSPPALGSSPGGAFGGRQGGGPAQYQIVSVDAKSWVVTARGPGGESVQLEVDPEAFAGYRFKAPVRGLRRGQGFALLALNQKPIAACCRVVGGAGGR